MTKTTIVNHSTKSTTAGNNMLKLNLINDCKFEQTNEM